MQISLTKRDATRVQAQLIKQLYGNENLSGYKVGLSNPLAQQQFRIDYPLVGELYDHMLLNDGADISVSSATVLLVELDLLVRVGSDQINTANSDEELVQYLDQVLPFIELPNAVFSLPADNAAMMLLATNVGAHRGVVGKPWSITNKKNLPTQLRAMQAQLSDGAGNVLRSGSGSGITENPLDSIRELREELAIRGKSLRRGQFISLGAIGGPLPAVPDTTYTATYSGLGADTLSVTVRITPE